MTITEMTDLTPGAGLNPIRVEVKYAVITHQKTTI